MITCWMHHALLADMGVPMIFVQWPLMLCALVPVIAVEAEVTRRGLTLPYRKAFAGAAKANVLSTLAGVPLAWVTMLAVEFATMLPLSLAAEKWHWSLDSPVFYVFYVLGIAWTGPVGTSAWPIPLAAALLLVPTFFVSVWLERPIYRRSYAGIDVAAVDRSVLRANLCSYALLFAAACGWLGWELYKGDLKAPATKRVLQEHPIDVAYLHDVVIPSCDVACRSKLVSSVGRLEACLADFESCMHDIEQGKIAVRKNLGRDHWESLVERPDSWIAVDYVDRLGPVMSVQKHENKHPFPMIYSFQFNRAGYITRADMPPDGFSFDEKGRLVHWHGEKCDCWGNPSK
jgi:hypothetical protein